MIDCQPSSASPQWRVASGTVLVRHTHTPVGSASALGMQRALQAPTLRQELLEAFPALDADVVDAVLSSTDGVLTADARASLGLPAGVAVASLWSHDETALALGVPVWLDGAVVEVTGPLGESMGARQVVFCAARRFGTYTLRSGHSSVALVSVCQCMWVAIDLDDACGLCGSNARARGLSGGRIAHLPLCCFA